MSSVWCVKPDDVKVDLVWTGAPDSPKPFWVRFKKRLNVGEDRQVKTAGLKSLTPADQNVSGERPEIGVDWRATAVVRVLVWMSDWSLTDDKDRKLPRTREQIEALNQDVFELIENALTAHVEAQEEEKKATAGKNEPSTTSA